MLTGMKSASSSFADTAASKVTLTPIISTVTSQYTFVLICVKRRLCLYVYHYLMSVFVLFFFLPEKCARVHWHLPYRWQVLDSSGVTWKDLPNMEDIEKAYCDPEHDTNCIDSPSPTMAILRFLSIQR